jgi:nucleotide-binding universal stress UspA family protein
VSNQPETGQGEADETTQTFVVGADASPESKAAIEWTRSVAGARDQIVLLSAWQVPVVAGYDMVVTVDPQAIERSAGQAVAEQMEACGDARLEPVVCQGHSGKALVAEAEQRQASMVVVGHRGNSRVSMMLGSTANYVLHHTTRPVVVVRGVDRQPPAGVPPRSVVVGVDAHQVANDGTRRECAENPSVRAVRWAYQLPCVERIRIVHAWFLPALAVGAFNELTTDTSSMDEAAEEVIELVLHTAGEPPAGVEVETEVLRGRPGLSLIDESHAADLVVVGSRGRGGFTELLLGSVTSEVAAHSHCPVAVIR